MNDKHKHHQAADLVEHVIPQYTALLEKVTRVRDELVSLNGVTRRGAAARPIINGASIKVATTAGQLAGFAIRETSGAAVATIRLRDGLDTSGDLLVPITIAAGGSAASWYLPHGIAFVTGLYVEVVTGAIEGTVFVGPFGAPNGS